MGSAAAAQIGGDLPSEYCGMSVRSLGGGAAVVQRWGAGW